jgi:NAD+ diphosphatase
VIRERSDNDQWAHDRLAHRRIDTEWLEVAWRNPASRILPISGGRVLALDGVPQWLTPDEVAAGVPGVDLAGGVRILLGERDGVARFAVHVSGAEADGFVGLRALGRHLMASRSDARLLFHAVGLGEWLDRTRFCATCGGALSVRQAGHMQVCDACGREQFPRIEPAVIMLITHGEPGSPEERCLLGSGLQWGPTRFSTLAGFAEPGEALEDAVRREVLEEAGIRVGGVTWFGSQPWPFPSSLMLGFTGRALTTDITVDPAELADARWFTREELRVEAESGAISLPARGVSISRVLVEHWYGAELPGGW